MYIHTHIHIHIQLETETTGTEVIYKQILNLLQTCLIIRISKHLTVTPELTVQMAAMNE